MAFDLTQERIAQETSVNISVFALTVDNGVDRIYAAQGTDNYIHQVNLSTTGDLSKLSLQTTINLGETVSRMTWSDGGNYLFVNVDNAKIKRYPTSTPFELSDLDITSDQEFDPNLGTLRGVDISDDGLHLIISDKDSGIEEDTFNSANDLTSSVSINGSTLSTDFDWLSMKTDDGSYIIGGDNEQSLWQFDMTEFDVTTITNKESVDWFSQINADIQYSPNSNITTADNISFSGSNSHGSVVGDRWIRSSEYDNSGNLWSAQEDKNSNDNYIVKMNGSGSLKNPTSYQWDFGDGNSASGENVTYSYSSSGTYTATLTVTREDGTTAQDTTSITVSNTPPDASFSFSPINPVVNQTTNFDGSLSSDPDGSINTYEWDFGDGGTDTGINPNHSYSSYGNYDVKLTVTDSDGGTDSITRTVTVSSPQSDFNKTWNASIADVGNQPSLNEFPIYIKMKSGSDIDQEGVLKFDDSNISSKKDIAFYDEDGNPLPYYWIKFDTNAGVYEAWVKHSIVRDGTEQISIGYENGSIDNSVTKDQVWNNVKHTIARYGFQSQSGQLKDSTRNNLDSNSTSSINKSSGGQFGNGWEYNSGTVDFNDNDLFSTVEGSDSFFSGIFWFKPDSSGSGFILKKNNSEYAVSWRKSNNGDKLQFSVDGTDSGENWPKSGSSGWRMGAFRYDIVNGAVELFINRNSTSISFSATKSNTSGNFFVGSSFEGVIDEVELFNGDPGKEWIFAHYDMSKKGGYQLLDWNDGQGAGGTDEGSTEISGSTDENVGSIRTAGAFTKTVAFPVILNNNFPNDADIFPSEFIVERQLEGPQIKIEWNDINEPGAVDEFVLTRRRRRFPLNKGDGTIVFQGSPEGNIINDLDVNPDIFYFYKLFVKRSLDNKYLSSDGLQGHDITYQSGEWGDKLYNLLPEIYRREDVNNAEEKGLFRPLEQTQDEDVKDIINHVEAQDKKFPELLRFLRNFGKQLDQIDQLTHLLSIITNFRKTGPKFLKNMTELLGIELNEQLSLERKRDQFRAEINKIKGKATVGGVEDSVRSTTGFDTLAIKGSKWMLESNNQEKTSFDVHDPEKMGKETPDNEAFYSWGGKTDSLSRFSMVLFIFTNPNESFTERKQEQTARAVEEATFYNEYEVYVFDKKGKIERYKSDELSDSSNNSQVT